MELKGIKPVILDEVLARRFRDRVWRVGVELEGGWVKLPKGVTQLVHDGSVRGLMDPDGAPVHHGEWPSPPLEVSQYEAWMKIHYPKLVNYTCGLHVHMSFKTALTYQRLMTPEYPVTVIEYLKRWAIRESLAKDHPLWARLRGESRYCQHVFYADDQSRTTTKDHDQSRPGHRYSIISYCYSRWGTAECRLLPMFSTAEQSISAVRELIRITNAFLAATGKKESRYRATVTDDLGLDEDQITIRV